MAQKEIGNKEDKNKIDGGSTTVVSCTPAFSTR